MLRTVDIASHQAGISPSLLDCDAVIIKVSGGTSYENPYWRGWADEALASGKLLGLYHYACEYDTEPGGRAEADFFWSLAKDYKGRFVPILDWENHATQMPVSYAKAFLDRIAELSGATPMFYGYASNVNSTDYSALSGYPLWMASYLYRYDGAGWVDDPANTWALGAWDGMAMYQYTSTGRISGWGGNLDLSVYYGNECDRRALQIGGSMGKKERMVQHAVGIAEDDSHGYSWADRWDVDRDCSSLMYDSADSAGYPVGRGPDKTRYTGTMQADFTAAGFTCHPYGSVTLQRGDILVRDPYGGGGHTEMYIGDGKTVGAHSAEDGGVYGEPGDQTGNEISITPLYGSWDFILRPPEDGGSMGKWIKEDGKWWYRHDDGSFTKNGWEFIDGHWYFFDGDGWMAKGWKKWKGHWYYLFQKKSAEGKMAQGWHTLSYNGEMCRFYFEESGVMLQAGFYRIDGAWYAFDKYGRLVKDDGLIKVNKLTHKLGIKTR